MYIKKKPIQFCVIYLEFRYETFELEAVLGSDEIGKQNINQSLLNLILNKSLNFPFVTLIFFAVIPKTK